MDAGLAYQLELDLWQEEDEIDQVNLALNTIEIVNEAYVSEYSLTNDPIVLDEYTKPLIFEEIYA
jgi:hypothetical protein